MRYIDTAKLKEDAQTLTYYITLSTLEEELRQAKEAYRQGDCTDEVIQVLETAITSYV